MIYPGSGAGRGSWLFTQPRKLRHYWAPSVSSRIIPGAGVAGLEFAVGSAWSEVRDFGFAWRNSFSKGRAVLTIPWRRAPSWMWEQVGARSCCCSGIPSPPEYSHGTGAHPRTLRALHCTLATGTLECCSSLHPGTFWR